MQYLFAKTERLSLVSDIFLSINFVFFVASLKK